MKNLCVLFIFSFVFFSSSYAMDPPQNKSLSPSDLSSDYNIAIIGEDLDKVMDLAGREYLDSALKVLRKYNLNAEQLAVLKANLATVSSHDEKYKFTLKKLKFSELFFDLIMRKRHSSSIQSAPHSGKIQSPQDVNSSPSSERTEAVLPIILCPYNAKDKGDAKVLKSHLKALLALKSTNTKFYAILTSSKMHEICACFADQAKQDAFSDMLRVFNGNYRHEHFIKIFVPALILVQAGADINSVNETGPGYPTTLLEIAVEMHDIERTEVLCQHKAKPNQIGAFNGEPLIANVRTAKLADTLFKFGALPPKTFSTLLKPSIEYCEPELFALFLDKKVEAHNTDTKNGNGIFHQIILCIDAARNFSPKMHEMLVEFAEHLLNSYPHKMIHCVNFQGHTPVDQMLMTIQRAENNEIKEGDKKLPCCKDLLALYKTFNGKTEKELVFNKFMLLRALNDDMVVAFWLPSDLIPFIVGNWFKA